MQNPELKNIIEAIIFGSDSELSVRQIKELLELFKISVTSQQIEQVVESLNIKYLETGSSFEIIKIAGGYQFATKKEYAQYLGKLYSESQRKKLTPSALETLSIIAYKQPVTRPEIEFIRGVNVDYIVNSLLERELISILGRADSPGRPILYGTTKNFLRVLGLNSLDELPKLREINEILKTEKVEGITEADIDLFYSSGTSENAQNSEPTVLKGEENKSPEISENQNEIETDNIEIPLDEEKENGELNDGKPGKDK